jgi:putative aldouronate transport system substrate-binding protein
VYTLQVLGFTIKGTNEDVHPLLSKNFFGGATMFKDKFKKVITLFLIMIIMTLSLSACGKSKNQTVSNEGKQDSNGKETLTIALQTYSFITDYKDNYLTKRLEEELGVNIEFHLLSADASEAATQLSLLFSSNQKMPDIICTGSMSQQAVMEYGSKGKLVALNDWLTDPEKAPNFNAIESTDDREAMIKASTSADGNIYSLTTFEPATWNMTPFRMYINDVWLNALNLDMPTTTEEYYQVLKAFAESDPNGNGIKDELPAYGISSGTYGENIAIPLMNSFIYYPASTATAPVLTLDGDGKTVIAPFIQEGWKEGLTYLNKLCSEGLLPASAFTDDKTQFMAVLNNEDANLVGSLSTGSLSRWNNYDTNVNGQEYAMMAPLMGPQGLAYSPFLEYKPAPIWFITSSCENPELALKLGDMFYNKDFSNIARYGEEGVDFTSDEEVTSQPQYSNAYIAAGLHDKVTLLVYKDIWSENNNKFWRNINPRYASISDNNTWASAVEYDPDVKSSYFYADNYKYNYEAHPENLLPDLTYTTEEAEEQAEVIVNVSTYVSQSMAQFITGARPLSDWDNYVKELETMGLSIWIENSQAAYERN